MMRKLRVRTLKELYEITQELLEPEITPVLKGSCRIQGPVDEVDLDIGTNSAVLPTEKGFGKHYSNEDIYMKASGTCNVCAAPCSSCMHFNRAVSFMESKAEGGISVNSCGRKEADNCSFSNSELPTFYKSKLCADRTQAASETSKMFSTTSSHDSYSENAESKATVKPEVHDVSEGVDMPSKLTSFETVEENQLPVEHNVNFQLSQEPTKPHMAQETFSNHLGDHPGLECHGDNNSCITGLRDVNVTASDLNTNLGRENMPCTSASTRALLGEGFEITALGQAADGEIVDKIMPCGSGKFTKGPSETMDDSFESLNAGFPSNHSGSPSLNGKPPEGQLLHSNSKIGNSLYGNAGVKDDEEDSASQLQAQASENLAEPVKSSLGQQMTTGCLDELMSGRVLHATLQPNHENGKASNITIHASSPKDVYQGSEAKTGQLDGNPTDDSTKHSILNQQHGKSSLSLETSKVQGSQPESQPTLKGDCPDPDTLEDDVKVCDICGDAGREDLLAICSRCSDGAEHIYCMRTMLDKVPEGDWLCEECKLKEIVTDKMEKTETLPGTLKVPCSNEKTQKVGSTINSKLLPKLDISTTDAEAPLASKGLKSPQMSAKRSSGIADIISLSNKKHSETSGASNMTASPSKKSMLSRESSFKNMDAGKAKQGNFAPPSKSQSPNSSSQVISRSAAPSPNSSRVQEQLQSPRGSLSRSGSFNNPKPKVKQVIENVPQKPQVTKEYSTGELKEGFVRTLGKSTSCKNVNSGQNIIEPTVKSQSINPHRSEESRNLKQSKERIIERKNSFISNQTLPSSSPAYPLSVSLSKADSKTLPNDWKMKSLSEPNASHPNKGSEEAHEKGGLKELRKQASHLSKVVGNHPSNGACSLADQRPTQIAPSEDAQVGSVGDTNTVPQRISAHSCSRDEKFKDSSASGSSRPVVSPSKRILRCQRCNETGHSTQFCSIDKLRVSALKPSAERCSREAVNKGNKWKDAVDAAISKLRMQKNFPDQSEEISSTDISSEIVSQNHSSSSSSCVKDLPSLVGTADKQSSLRSSTVDISKAVNDIKQNAPQLMETVCTSRDGESNAFSSHREELKVKPSTQTLPEHHSVLFDPSKVSALPDHEYIWQGTFEVKRAGRLSELCDGVQAHLSTCASPKVLKVVTKFSEKLQLEEVARLSSWPLQFQENSPTEENIALFFFAKDFTSYEKSYSRLLESMLKNDLALKANFDGIELLIFPSSKLPEKSQRWNQLFFLWGVFRERRPNCSGTRSGLQSKSNISNFTSEHIVHDLSSQLVTEVAASEKESSHEGTNKDMSRVQKSTAQLCLEAKSSSTTTCQVDFIAGSHGGKDDELAVCVQNSGIQNVHNHAKDGAVLMITSNPGPPDLNEDAEDMTDASSESNVKHQHSSLPVLGAGAIVGSKDEAKMEGSSRLTEKGTALDSVSAVTVDKTQYMRLVSGLPNKKRAYSNSPEHVLQSSGEASVGASTDTLQRQKAECIVLDDEERESKKVKVHSKVPAFSSSGIDIFGDKISSKVHPLLANFRNEPGHPDKVLHNRPTLPEISRKPERYLFPFDFGSTMDKKSGRSIPLQILSSDDECEYRQESETPNLELALGAEKRPVKQEILPLSFPLVGKNKNQGKLPDPAMDDGDEPASLSLSLAFPFSGKEQVQKPVSKTEQLLPKRPRANSSLHLFGGFADS
uniref:Bromodomain adjacent to zinc finger domain protein 1A n=1 Tax=Anthurium amnicola TaxID=1678845 RepID=A0A1D1YD19_9ARAE